MKAKRKETTPTINIVCLNKTSVYVFAMKIDLKITKAKNRLSILFDVSPKVRMPMFPMETFRRGLFLITIFGIDYFHPLHFTSHSLWVFFWFLLKFTNQILISFIPGSFNEWIYWNKTCFARCFTMTIQQ